jgi:hypothetical protein
VVVTVGANKDAISEATCGVTLLSTVTLANCGLIVILAVVGVTSLFSVVVTDIGKVAVVNVAVAGTTTWLFPVDTAID